MLIHAQEGKKCHKCDSRIFSSLTHWRFAEIVQFWRTCWIFMFVVVICILFVSWFDTCLCVYVYIWEGVNRTVIVIRKPNRVVSCVVMVMQGVGHFAVQEVRRWWSHYFSTWRSVGGRRIYWSWLEKITQKGITIIACSAKPFLPFEQVIYRSSLFYPIILVKLVICI